MWQQLSHCGTSGQILAQGRSYDNGGNVTSVNTTMAAVPGQSSSGGSETQNFCYDEQNRLIWAGDGGTQPGAGSGTCGTGTLANSFSGAGYTNAYSYTNLGQLWQAPIDGSTNAKTYLYCDSAHPHQLTGVYEGGTCASRGTADYTATYDPWGNVSSFNLWNGWKNDTLSYDALNRLVSLTDSGSAASEQYVYDASGNRVLKRSTSAGTTTLTAYAFGLQELSYSGSGVYASQNDFYSLAGHLIGWTNGTNTTYDLTDAQGSVLLSLSATSVQGEQLFDPYGGRRYTSGSLGTDKGYTGQFTDTATGLDYYNARYYLRDIGVFLSPDNVQGNAQGMDPYSYVAGNPETKTDPTGQKIVDPGPGGGGNCPKGEHAVSGGCSPNTGPGGTAGSPDPGSGGCDRGYHPEPGDGMCVKDGGGPAQAKLPACTGVMVGGQCVSKSAIHDGQAKAYNDAQTASFVFNMIGIFFAALGAIAQALVFAQGWWDWLSVPILQGIALGFFLLAAQAFAIAAVFGREGHSTGDSTSTDTGWFTHDNINAKLAEMHGIAGGAASLLGGGALKLFTSLGADAALVNAEKAAGLNEFGISFGLTELFGGMALSGVITHFGDIQNGDVLT